MKNHSFLFVALVFILLALVGSCTIDGTGSDYAISGQIQKGPFVSGTSIKIQELNAQMSPNGTSYETITNDDFGAFQIATKMKSRLVEIVATGYYYNEITGTLSDGPLTLRALADLSVSSIVNINVLTTIEENRIKYLISTGLGFADAKTRAEEEVLSVFNIPSSSIAFSEMDITQARDVDGILLAVSAILQNGNSVAQLSELLSHLSLAIKSTGLVADTSLQAELVTNSYGLDLGKIRQNLQARYSSLGMTISIPPFEGYALLLNTNAPTVVSTYPIDNGTTSVPKIKVAATFGEKMDATSLTDSTFTLSYGTTAVSGTVGYDAKTLTAFFQPSTNIPDGTVVTAKLDSSIVDFAGNKLGSNKTWTFTVNYPTYMYIQWSPQMSGITSTYTFSDANSFSSTGLVNATFDIASLQEGETATPGNSVNQIMRKNGIPCLVLYEGYSGSSNYVDAVVKVSLLSPINGLEPYQIQASALKVFGWNGGSGQYMYSGFDIYNWLEL